MKDWSRWIVTLAGTTALTVAPAGAQPPSSGPPLPLPSPSSPQTDDGNGPPPGYVRPGQPLPPQRLPPPDFYRDAEVGRPLRDFAWIYVPEPEPRVFKVHDLITIIVNEKSQTTLNSRFNRQRTAMLKAEIKEFIRIGTSGNLRPAALDSPTIDTNLQERMQTTGQATDQEGMSYRIAATVVDILPNGNLVLEARKTIRANRDLWQFSLTGKIRSIDVARDNTALSENVAELNIVKHQQGKVYDSTRVPWGSRLHDMFFPF